MGSRPFDSHNMKLLFLVGLVGLSQGAYLPYLHYAVPTFKLSTVATGDSVPVAIGGYKAVAGEGGAVHEVPGLLPAPAHVKQESEGGVSLSTGTSARTCPAQGQVCRRSEPHHRHWSRCRLPRLRDSKTALAQ